MVKVGNTKYSKKKKKHRNLFLTRIPRYRKQLERKYNFKYSYFKRRTYAFA